jgi:choline monooxygenase
LTPDLSIQQAPPRPSQQSSDQRFGNQTAVYAQWYPNLMLNRYGPWLDLDLVIPVTTTTTLVKKAWFLERDYTVPSADYLETSLESSEQVHSEDVFLCENAQLGLNSRGFETGRYVPTKQIATYHFHQRLARDLRHYLDGDS